MHCFMSQWLTVRRLHVTIIYCFQKKEGSTQHTCTFLARVMVWFRATHSYPSRQKQTNTVAQIVSLTRSQHNKWRFLWIAQLGISQFNEHTVAVSELPGYQGRWHLVSSWVEKNSVPPLNCWALDWSVVPTIGQLCPIIPQDNIVASNKHNWPEFYPGNARIWNLLCERTTHNDHHVNPNPNPNPD